MERVLTCGAGCSKRLSNTPTFKKKSTEILLFLSVQCPVWKFLHLFYARHQRHKLQQTVCIMHELSIVIPESVCEGFFVKKHLQNYISSASSFLLLCASTFSPILTVVKSFFPKALRRVLPENPLNTDTSTLTLIH